MSLRSRIELLPLGVAGLLLALGACHNRNGAQQPPAPPRPGVIASALSPGEAGSLVTDDPNAAKYYDNAEAVTTGMRLYKAYNCSGCHSAGGGGMGVDLMDDVWIYGGRLAQIHQTLVEGRPNGMPAWRGKIPDAQIWQLTAYVRSLSGLVPKDVAPSRNDHMTANPPENATPRLVPKNSGVPPASVH